MLLFPLYAVVIWALAAKWRRTWKGFAAVLVGTVLLLLIEYTLYRLGNLKLPLIQPKQALGLLIPFTVLVFLVGVFIACQRRPTPSPIHCTKCHYDLTGLNPAGLHCPECGAEWRGVGSGFASEPRRRPARRLGAARAMNRREGMPPGRDTGATDRPSPSRDTTLE
ncbi:MAG: hypothetical protein AB7G11_10920 [Phycisphaerales bacterium]